MGRAAPRGRDYSCQKLREAFLLLLGHHQVGQSGKLPRVPLGVAAGGHHEGLGVLPADPPQEMAGLGICLPGNGAGVYDTGPRRLPTQDIARFFQTAAQLLAFRLVQLTAQGDKGYPGHRPIICLEEEGDKLTSFC